MSTQSIQFTDSNGNISLPESAESGSNANGSYTKFADGTLICWGIINTPMDITTSVEGFYRGNAVVYLPMAFVDSNYSVLCQSQNYGAFLSHAVGTNENRFDVYGLSTISKSNVQFTVRYIAIGRWK